MSDDTDDDERSGPVDDDRPSDALEGGRDWNGRPDRFRGGDLPPGDVDRVFDLLEAVLAADVLTDEQFNRLLAVLDRAVSGTSADPETLEELFTLLETVLLDPETLNQVDVDQTLGLFEEALAGVPAANRTALTDVFDVLEAGFRDPAGVEPEDIERFQSSIQDAIADLTGPTGDLDALRSLAEEADSDSPVDPFRIARLGAAMTQRASGYSVESGVRAGTRLAYAAANAESATKLLTTARAITLDELQRAGIDIGDEQAEWLEAHEEGTIEPRPLTREALEERGARLLARSSEVGRDESVHPAFVSILDQLSTDEARILRLLATDGPQGVIDIYDRQYLPPKRSRVARNLTMLGRDAGCRLPRRTPVYVQNLQRLGIAEVADKPIADLKRYQVIEAQSHIEHARTRASRPRSVYKRFQLTDLGVAFCELCFPFEVTVDGEGLALRENNEGDR